jgi:hypothetical protein
MLNSVQERRMRAACIGMVLLLLMPVSGAWQAPPIPETEASEWIVADAEGWTHTKWVALRDEGLEPLRQLSSIEVLVWGDHGSKRVGVESILRGPHSEMGYRVILEPRLPHSAQWNIIDGFAVDALSLAGPGSSLSTSFELRGVDPTIFDSIPGVFWVEPLLRTGARNELSSSIMETGQMSGHPAWSVGLNGSGVIIAVADSGIELDHGCFREGPTEIGEIGADHRKVIGVNTTIDDGDHPGQEDYRHGTHIAGTLACAMVDGNQSMGTSPSHAARLLFQDVVNVSGWSEPTVDWLLAEAFAQGAIIHSDSWGDDTEAYTLRSAEFDLWHREVPWSLAFIAPGNNPSRFYEPANARNVVSVGGSIHDDSNNLYASSSHGPTEENLRGNFVVAPATGIMSAAADGNLSSFNDDMRGSTGTSMSTPLAASITAVIQQMVQDGWIRGSGEDNLTIDGVNRTNGSTPSGPLLRALLALSAESMEGGQQGGQDIGPSPGPLQGWGRPNLMRLIDFESEDPSPNIWIHDSFRMEEDARQALAIEWLSSPGGRPLEQVAGHLWDGSSAAGPFLALGDDAIWELPLMPGEDLEVFLSFNQRPFGSVSDDLDLIIHLPDGTVIESGEAVEGTEVIRIKADELIGVDSVVIEVRAIAVGVGNHTGVLGSDGDRLGFALAARGIQRTDTQPVEIHEDRITINGVTQVSALYNATREDLVFGTPTQLMLAGDEIERWLAIERDLGTALNLSLSLAVEGEWAGVSLNTGMIQGEDAILLECVEIEPTWEIEGGVVEIEIEGAFVPMLILPNCAVNSPMWIRSDWGSDEWGSSFDGFLSNIVTLMDEVRNGSDNDLVAAYQVHLDLNTMELPWWNSSGSRESGPVDLVCEFHLDGVPFMPCDAAFMEGLLLSSENRGSLLSVYLSWAWGGVQATMDIPVMMLVPQPIRAVDGVAANVDVAPLLTADEDPDVMRVETGVWIPLGGWPVLIDEGGHAPQVVLMQANQTSRYELVVCRDVWVSTPRSISAAGVDYAGSLTYELNNVTLWVLNLEGGEFILDESEELMFWQGPGGETVALSVTDVERAYFIPGPDCGIVEVTEPTEPVKEGVESEAPNRILIMLGGFLLALIVTLLLTRDRWQEEEDEGVPDPFVRAIVEVEDE